MKVGLFQESSKPQNKRPAQNVPRSMSFKKPRQTGFNAHAKAIGAAASNGPEWKNVDTTASLTGGASSAWSAITCINLIAQGTTANQHVGRKIAIHKLITRYQVAPTGTGVAHRLLIVYDNHANGALPVITDILTSDAFTSLQNLDNSDRFMVLADIYPFEANGAPAASAASGVGGKIVRKFNPPLLTQFNAGTTAAITAIQNGSILIMLATNGSPSGASTIHFSRVRFTDS